VKVYFWISRWRNKGFFVIQKEKDVEIQNKLFGKKEIYKQYNNNFVRLFDGRIFLRSYKNLLKSIIYSCSLCIEVFSMKKCLQPSLLWTLYLQKAENDADKSIKGLQKNDDGKMVNFFQAFLKIFFYLRINENRDWGDFQNSKIGCNLLTISGFHRISFISSYHRQKTALIHKGGFGKLWNEICKNTHKLIFILSTVRSLSV